jgi:hypothetical protein
MTIRNTSKKDPGYNCFAWAAGDDTKWWEPGGRKYWPLPYPRKVDVAAIEAAYATLGYIACADGTLEPGFEKIAIFAIADQPKHAARQFQNGVWTSKLGSDEDIEHDRVAEFPGLVAIRYGRVARFMKRALPQGASPPQVTPPHAPGSAQNRPPGSP